MKFHLKKRKYGWYDLFFIPFLCSPVPVIGLGIQKMLVAVAAIALIPSIASLVDITTKAIHGTEHYSNAIIWFLLLICCLGYRRVSFIFALFFAARIEADAAVVLGQAFTEKRSRLHYRHFENQDSWNLISRVCSKYEQNVSMMIQRVINVVLYSVRIVGVLYIVYTQVWWIGIIISLLCIPLFIISLKGGEKNYSVTKKTADFERRHQYLAEVLTGRDTVDERALFGFSEHLNKEWYEKFENARKIRLGADIRMMISVRGASIIATLLSTLITLILVYPTVKGQISIGMFIALASSMLDLINMVGQDMAKAFTQLSWFNGYMKDLTLFASLDEAVNSDCKPLELRQRLDTIEFRNVSFSYPGSETKILDNVSFTINESGHYAFVGVNGAGKTTITKLLAGLYDNYEGQILINGKELRAYSQGELKSFFTGVYQDFARYQIPLIDNICIGDINAMDHAESHRRAEEILSELNALYDFKSLPDGLKSTLGKVDEKGVDISGGQWQKVAMARALMSPAPVLILDEPTAALDPVSESNLYEQFESVSKGKTCIFISHRLGSTKLADTIYVLKNGTVNESGSHEVLMERKGDYCTMFESQRSWYR